MSRGLFWLGCFSFLCCGWRVRGRTDNWNTWNCFQPKRAIILFLPNWLNVQIDVHIHKSWQTGQIRMTRYCQFHTKWLVRNSSQSQVWAIMVYHKLHLFVCHQSPRSIIFNLSIKKSCDFSFLPCLQQSQRKMAPRLAGHHWHMMRPILREITVPGTSSLVPDKHIQQRENYGRMKKGSYNHHTCRIVDYLE